MGKMNHRSVSLKSRSCAQLIYKELCTAGLQKHRLKPAVRSMVY